MFFCDIMYYNKIIYHKFISYKHKQNRSLIFRMSQPRKENKSFLNDFYNLKRKNLRNFKINMVGKQNFFNLFVKTFP